MARQPLETIPFSGSVLDRVSARRIDAHWIEQRRCDPSTLILPFRRLEPLLFDGDTPDSVSRLGFISSGAADSLVPSQAVSVFLGLDGDRALFALDVTGASESAIREVAGRGRFCEARTAGQIVSISDTAIIAQGKALIDWHRRHGFCPNCGSRTDLMDAGYRRLCGQCNTEHFPRVDPVVIMLATDADACLVGRGKQFPPGMFSALAGFVEPGETIEEAVQRELMEEASAAVYDIRYQASQPWPFPSSLMIGCFARARSREIKVDENELAEVRWLERDLVRDILEGKPRDGVRLPPPVAIAFHLIKAWAFGEG
jgi:NAD+ diphosphatase